MFPFIPDLSTHLPEYSRKCGAFRAALNIQHISTYIRHRKVLVDISWRFFRLDYWIVLCYKGRGGVVFLKVTLGMLNMKAYTFLVFIVLGEKKKRPEGRKHGNDIFPSVGSPSPRAISCDMRDNMICVVFAHFSGLTNCDIYHLTGATTWYMWFSHILQD